MSAHLGLDAGTVPLVGEDVPSVDRVNVQLALDAFMEGQPEPVVLGISPEIARYGGFSVSALLGARFRGPSDVVPPTYEDLAAGVDRTVRCVVSGVWLLHMDDVPVAVVVLVDERHGPRRSAAARIEVAAEHIEVAQRVLGELQRLRVEHNVYRGEMLAFTFSEHGEFGIQFTGRPTTGRDDVILPPGVLDSIERHTIGIEARAAQLLAAGQHLKRGLLLHGPPGTGKTLTTGYLTAAMPERTVIVLQGPSIAALGQAAAIVHALTPSMLVLEDVDLIAHARGMPGMETNPLLFELLNLMDGLAPDADVVFVLTTNRVDLLEPALATRPGRIDHAVEIGRPDADARARLLELYLAAADHRVGALDELVTATDGVTASFIKELVRRATMDALDADEPIDEATLLAAAHALLDAAPPILRTSLGGGDQVPAAELDEPPPGTFRRGPRPGP
ncbi:MAG: ATP-binding protein [Actinomycetota bacterium]